MEKVSAIARKQVFETGNEKDFIRAKDIAFLIQTIENQEREINRLKEEDEYVICPNCGRVKND